MRARQVVRDERGQEVILSFGSSPVKLSPKEDTESTSTVRAPDYLDEVDKTSEPVNTKAVARIGDVGASVGGWFSAIGGRLEGIWEMISLSSTPFGDSFQFPLGYVSKALYW